MSYSTASDLAVQVLYKARVLPDGQTPQVEDTASVTTAIPLVLETLAAREIIYVPDTSNIPDAWIMPLAWIIANEMRSNFGITGEEANELSNSAIRAEAQLKSMLRGRPTGEAQRTLYF